MEDVRSKFAGVPLFDQNLNAELLALERRQLAQTNHTENGHVLPGGPNRFFSMGDIPPSTGGVWAAHAGDGGGTLRPAQPTAVYPPGSAHGPRSHSPLSVDLSPSSSQSPAPAASRMRPDFAGRAAAEATFALPPKIMRPWSVEVLMRRGELASANLRHSQFDNDAQRPPLQSRLAHRRGVAKGRHGEEGADRFMNASTRRRGHVGNSPNAADSSSPDDEYRQGMNPERHHTADSFLHSEQPLTSAVGQATTDLLEDLDDFTLNEQIERAATRRRIQEDRLGKLGLHPPGFVMGSEQQTSARDLRFEPDAHGVPSSNERSDFSNIGELLARIVGASTARTATTSISVGSGSPLALEHSKPKSVTRESHHSKAPIVLDAVGYREYTTSKEAAAGDTIWRRMLVEEKHPSSRAPGAPSAYALASQSTAGSVTPRNAAAAARELHVTHDPSQVHSTQPGASNLFETKSALMRQLDQMQVANEEMLVRNKIVTSTSASDLFRPNSHRALEHVAAAHRAAAVPAMAPPEGGYGGVADRLATEERRSHADSVGNHDDSIDASHRWHIASGLDGGAGANRSHRTDLVTTPLRRWATDHSNLVPSTTHHSSLPKAKIGGAAQQGHPNFVYAPHAAESGYDARKKWSGVSFANQQDAGGYNYFTGEQRKPQHLTALEQLSQSAAEFMHPDPSAFTSSSALSPY